MGTKASWQGLERQNIDFINALSSKLKGSTNMPTIKNAKKKVEDEAKKASVDAKKVGGKVADESKKVASEAKKAGVRVAEDTKKVAKKVKEKM